jgi:very-short-patch-repair endonuclease
VSDKLNELIIESFRPERESFDSLPDKAKEMFFCALQYIAEQKNDYITDFVMLWQDNYECCQSPIEKMLFLAFNTVRLLRFEELPNDYEGLFFIPQYEVVAGDKQYRADFYIELEDCTKKGLVVECDGHEFHQKTKQQVCRDNEREFAIKKCGYDVLRFSGSQIYNEPFKCANDVFDYLLLMIEKEGK